MQRQLSGPSIPPVVIPRVNGATSGFRFVRLISSGGVIPAPIDAQTFGRRSCSGTYDWEKLLICTEDGTLQYLQLEADESSDIYSSFTASTTQVAYAPLSVAIGNAQVETLTAAAVSSTGDFTAIGTSAGVVGQYYRVLSATDEAHYIPKINKYSPNSKVTDQHLLLHQGEPTNFKKPLLSLPIDSLVLGTAYTICPPRSMLYADSITGRASHCPIASSYGNTPKLANTRLRFTSSRLVHNDVRTAMVKHDFIGTVSNASFKFGSNSMLYGTNAKRAYQNCDPRKGVTNSEIPEIPLQLFGDGSKNIDFANPTSSDFTSAPIPSNYKLLRSFRSGKSRVRRFDYSLYNVSTDHSIIIYYSSIVC